MHVTNTALFLVVFALIIGAPIVLVVAGIVRRQRLAHREAAGARPSPARALVVALVAVTAVGALAVWFARSSPSDTTDMAGMDMSGTDTGLSEDGAADDVPLPGMLGGLPMVDSVSGPAALDQVAQLHGSTFDIVDAAVATYLDSAGTSTVWVAWAANASAAEAMTREMADGISSGGSPFDPPSRWTEDRSVWVTNGMGQRHYFFARGNAVWWVAADPGVARSVLEDVLSEAGP